MTTPCNPNLKNIRTLLLEGFDEADLRRFCHDEPKFKPVFHKLADNASKKAIIDDLIIYAEQHFSFEILLAWAKESNSTRYEEHMPYWEDIISPPTSVVKPRKDQKSELEESAIKSNLSEDWLKAGEDYWENSLFVQSAAILTEQADKLLMSVYSRQAFKLLLKFNQNQLLEEGNLWKNLLVTRAQFAFQFGGDDKADIAKKDYNLLYNLTDDPESLIEIGRVHNRAREYKDAFRIVNDAKEQILQKSYLLTKDRVTYLLTRVDIEMGRAVWGLGKKRKGIDLLKKSLRFFQMELTALEKLTLWQEAEGVLQISKIPKGYRGEAAWALRYLGLAYESRNQVAAIACWAASQPLWTGLGAALNMAAMQTNLGAIYFDYGIDLPRASYWFKKAEKTFQKVSVSYDWARFYNNWAYFSYRWGKLKKALMTSKQIFNNLSKEEGFTAQLAEILDVRAAIYTVADDFPKVKNKYFQKAENDYKKARELSREILDTEGGMKSGLNLGLMYLAWGCSFDEAGDQIKALEKHNQAKSQFILLLNLIDKEKLEIDSIDLIEIQAGLSEALLKTKRPEDARKQIEQAISAIAEDTPFFIKARAFRVMGELLCHEGKLTEARIQFLKAWGILSKDPDSTGIDKEEIWVLKDLVGLCIQMGQAAEAEKIKGILAERQRIYSTKIE